MKKMKKGVYGECPVFVCNLCGDQITSVRFGGYQSEEVGDDIHICSACCAEPSLSEGEREKARTLINIYEILKSFEGTEPPPYWPREPNGETMPIASISAIAIA